jgi:hypothetical protein
MIDAEETLHRAIRIRAAKEEVPLAEVVNGILRKALAAELAEAIGVPPLAAVIQTHHDRQQEVLRQQNQAPRSEGTALT